MIRFYKTVTLPDGRTLDRSYPTVADRNEVIGVIADIEARHGKFDELLLVSFANGLNEVRMYKNPEVVTCPN